MTSKVNLDRLKQLFTYNPETGIFYRNKATNNGIPAGSVAGNSKGDGYLRIQIDGKSYTCHRLAWFYYYGKWPNNQVDHLNGIRDDNRIVNLRDVTAKENSRNAKLSENNSTGAKGVYWEESKCRWSARIWYDGKSKRLGMFRTFEEAVEARKAAEIELGFHPNHGKDLSEVQGGSSVCFLAR